MLASYRIAFAKQYMLDNPNASVDDVAEVSGFGDRSTFFHKFKEVTGMSPKVWLTKQ
jgi:AraC-like DNA-binding protein